MLYIKQIHILRHANAIAKCSRKEELYHRNILDLLPILSNELMELHLII